MKLVRTITWKNIPPLEYFRDELEWDVNSMEEVAEYLNDYALDDLYSIYGWHPTETTEIVDD